MYDMKLDNRTKALIGIGASITANCEPCVQRHVSLAKEIGVNEQEIAEAIALGRMIRKGIAGKMDKFIAQMGSSVPITSESGAGTCCG
jgi:AhpD family alkylhydroperoxidase